MGARGGPIVELIEPVAGEVGFYRDFLPVRRLLRLRLHHLATFMPLGDEAWSALGSLLARHGMQVDYTVLIPDRVRAGYVDTTALLGHWLEVCQLQAADVEFFSGLVDRERLAGVPRCPTTSPTSSRGRPRRRRPTPPSISSGTRAPTPPRGSSISPSRAASITGVPRTSHPEAMSPASSCATRGGRWARCGWPARWSPTSRSMGRWGPERACVHLDGTVRIAARKEPPGRAGGRPGAGRAAAGVRRPLADRRRGPRGLLRRRRAVRLRHHGRQAPALRARPERARASGRLLRRTPLGRGRRAHARRARPADDLLRRRARRSTWTAAARRRWCTGGTCSTAPTRTGISRRPSPARS